MPEATPEIPKPQHKPVLSAIGQAIDKLTDPLELAIRKVFSARFLIAVGSTLAFYRLSSRILAAHPDSAAVIFACWATAWTTIVGTYFGASMMTPIDGKKKDQPSS